MEEEIRYRQDFEDTDIENTPYIIYEPYKEIPYSEDYFYGRENSILLKNKDTDKLERIDYILCGAIPFRNRTGYRQYWGEIQLKDNTLSYITFYFDKDGKLDEILVSFIDSESSPGYFIK